MIGNSLDSEGGNGTVPPNVAQETNTPIAPANEVGSAVTNDGFVTAPAESNSLPPVETGVLSGTPDQSSSIAASDSNVQTSLGENPAAAEPSLPVSSVGNEADSVPTMEIDSNANLATSSGLGSSFVESAAMASSAAEVREKIPLETTLAQNPIKETGSVETGGIESPVEEPAPVQEKISPEVYSSTPEVTAPAATENIGEAAHFQGVDAATAALGSTESSTAIEVPVVNGGEPVNNEGTQPASQPETSTVPVIDHSSPAVEVPQGPSGVQEAQMPAPVQSETVVETGSQTLPPMSGGAPLSGDMPPAAVSNETIVNNGNGGGAFSWLRKLFGGSKI